MQSGSPEVSVTYQKVEQLSCHSYVSVTVLELRTFMRNTLDFTPTFSVGGCLRACALPRLTKVSLPQGLGQGAWFRKKYAEIVPFRIHIMKYTLMDVHMRIFERRMQFSRNSTAHVQTT